MSREFRRIVTTNDSNGKSEILIDGPATNELASILTEMWVTDGGSHNHTDRLDHAMKWKSLEPPAGGTVFRFFRLRPMSAFEGLSEEQREQRIAQVFASMNATHTLRDVSKNPGMHQTQTTDYVVLLSGKVRLVLDKEERDLEPFDVVVQRGTNPLGSTRGARKRCSWAYSSPNGWLGREAEANLAIDGLHKLKPGFTVQDFVKSTPSDNPRFQSERARIVEGLRKAGLPEGQTNSN